MTESLLNPEVVAEETTAAAEPNIVINNHLEETEKSEQESKEVSIEELKSLLAKKVEMWTPEEVAAYNKLNGVELEADAYSLPEGFDEDTGKWFKGVAAELKLPKAAALELANKFKEYTEASTSLMSKAAEEVAAKNIENLRSEFGSAFEARVKLANNAAMSIGGADLITALSEAGLGTNPAVIKALAKVGQMMAEDTIPASKSSSMFGMTPDEAKRKIELTMSDRELRDAYFDRHNPKHQTIVSEVTKLYEMAYPE